MSAFNDGRCGKCNRRMGWTGRLEDKPACTHCGHKPTPKEIEEFKHDQKIMDDFEEQLRQRKK